jgi:tRNA A37 N6-isopentenylltransferase MiaA
MVEAGGVAEAAALQSLDSGLPAFKALGLRELLGYLRANARLRPPSPPPSRPPGNYAKRQMT